MSPLAPQPPHQQAQKEGLFWGFVSYFLWGFFPVYWKLLSHRPAMEILAHRMIWSFLFYLLMYVGFHWHKLKVLFQQKPKDWLLSSLAALLLSINWGLYVYAVNNNQILEGSLAYFMNPLLNVLVGVLFFKEKFPWPLRFAVFFAFLGVLAKMTTATGFPWLALTLAFTFCAYGITKKILTLPARTSSALEGAVTLPFAFLILLYFGQTAEQAADWQTWLLFVFGGIVTGLPLFLFSFAAQRIPYSTMGMLQFIAPSLQFLVAIFMFHEPFGISNLIAFGFIWIGVLFYLGFLLKQNSANSKHALIK